MYIVNFCIAVITALGISLAFKIKALVYKVVRNFNVILFPHCDFTTQGISFIILWYQDSGSVAVLAKTYLQT